MDKMDRKRSAHFTKQEEAVLLSLVEKYKDIIECKESGAKKWQAKMECWEKIASKFSHLTGYKCLRSAKVLKTKYLNLKKDAKAKFLINKNSILRSALETSEMDEKIKEIEHVQVTPFQSFSDEDDSMLTDLKKENVWTEDSSHDTIDQEPYVNTLVNAVINDSINDSNCNATRGQLNESQQSTNIYQNFNQATAHTPINAIDNTQNLPDKTLHKAKMEFIRLQMECLKEEHALKVENLRLDILLKKKQLNLD